jgi:hypothetical protein
VLIVINSKQEGQLSSAIGIIIKLEAKEADFDELKKEHGKLLGKYELLTES